MTNSEKEYVIKYGKEFYYWGSDKYIPPFGHQSITPIKKSVKILLYDLLPEKHAAYAWRDIRISSPEIVVDRFDTLYSVKFRGLSIENAKAIPELRDLPDYDVPSEPSQYEDLMRESGIYIPSANTSGEAKRLAVLQLKKYLYSMYPKQEAEKQFRSVVPKPDRNILGARNYKDVNPHVLQKAMIDLAEEVLYRQGKYIDSVEKKADAIVENRRQEAHDILMSGEPFRGMKIKEMIPILEEATAKGILTKQEAQELFDVARSETPEYADKLTQKEKYAWVLLNKVRKERNLRDEEIRVFNELKNRVRQVTGAPVSQYRPEIEGLGLTIQEALQQIGGGLSRLVTQAPGDLLSFGAQAAGDITKKAGEMAVKGVTNIVTNTGEAITMTLEAPKKIADGLPGFAEGFFTDIPQLPADFAKSFVEMPLWKAPGNLTRQILNMPVNTYLMIQDQILIPIADAILDPVIEFLAGPEPEPIEMPPEYKGKKKKKSKAGLIATIGGLAAGAVFLLSEID